MSNIILLVVILSFVIGILILIGYMVYKDAKNRGMNAALWALVAVFVPNLLGVIIYLIVRSQSEGKLICKQCKNEVKKDYSICPYCSNQLGQVCRGCGIKVEGLWKVCPQCGTRIELEDNGLETTGTVTQNNNRSTKTLLVIIISAIAVSFILLIVGSIMVAPKFVTDSGLSIMSTTSSFNDSFKHSYARFDGKKTIPIKSKTDGTLTITANSNIKDGDLDITVLDGAQNKLYKFTSVGSNNFVTTCKKSDVFYVEVISDNSKGSYEIHWNFD